MLQRAGNGGKMDRESGGRSRRGNTRITKNRPGRSRKRIETHGTLPLRPSMSHKDVTQTKRRPRTPPRRVREERDACPSSLRPSPSGSPSGRHVRAKPAVPFPTTSLSPNDIQRCQQYAYTTSVTPPDPSPSIPSRPHVSSGQYLIKNTPPRRADVAYRF
jgi:hypothetical protein